MQPVSEKVVVYTGVVDVGLCIRYRCVCAFEIIVVSDWFTSVAGESNCKEFFVVAGEMDCSAWSETGFGRY